MNPKCVDFIKNYVKKYNVKNVLEFGSGATKLFESLDCLVITIEHNPTYYLVVRELCKSSRVFPILAMDGKSYIIMTKLIKDVDLVFIDGILRKEIMEIMIGTTMDWDTVMVHDSERKEYQPCFKGFKRMKCNIIDSGVNLFVCQKKRIRKK